VKLTRRGRIAVALLIIAVFYLIVKVSANLWYVEGNGYCWGSVNECYTIEGENK
jgi:hypothetical protein